MPIKGELSGTTGKIRYWHRGEIIGSAYDRRGAVGYSILVGRVVGITA